MHNWENRITIRQHPIVQIVCLIILKLHVNAWDHLLDNIVLSQAMWRLDTPPEQLPVAGFSRTGPHNIHMHSH